VTSGRIIQPGGPRFEDPCSRVNFTVTLTLLGRKGKRIEKMPVYVGYSEVSFINDTYYNITNQLLETRRCRIWKYFAESRGAWLWRSHHIPNPIPPLLSRLGTWGCPTDICNTCQYACINTHKLPSLSKARGYATKVITSLSQAVRNFLI